MRIYILFLAVITVIAACNSQAQAPLKSETAKVSQGLSGDLALQAEGEIRGIWQDTKGNMWFASNGNGVYMYDGATLVNYTEKHGLSSNYVWMVQEGKDGNMWFKTYLRSNGKIVVCRFDGHTFTAVEPETNLVNSGFGHGFLLCGLYLDGKMPYHVQVPHTSPIKNEHNASFHYDLYASCLDKKGNAWLGTCTAGLCKYDGKAYTWFTSREMTVPIRDIFEDQSGVVWVGNNGGGLFRYDGKDFVNFSKEKNLHNPDFETNLKGKPGMLARIWKITQDKEGNLWVATIDNGIWRYDGQNLTNYTTKDGLGTNSIWTLYVDNSNKLWVGTGEAGIYVFNGGRFEKFTGLK